MHEHDPRLDTVVTVTMTVYQARALRISSLMGGPPLEESDPLLDEARNILGRAENDALAREIAGGGQSSERPADTPARDAGDAESHGRGQ